jgi:transaldolase / glucose-6-phosphate isomerase
LHDDVAMAGGRLAALAGAGQAVWLDYLHRRILEDGELARRIERDGLSGLTSNPAIFEQAMGGGEAYDAAIAELIANGDAEPGRLYEQLAIADLRRAADLFAPVFHAAGGRDGFVSLEVSPYLAMDAQATIAEARRLWRAVERPNLMIKVPGTSAGAEAIRTLIGEGISVNVTLLFSLESYLAAAEAHLVGLETLRASGGDVTKAHGVASFFVSRIDGVIDRKIDARPAGDPAHALRGKVAIANARIAYQHYLTRLETPRWRALAEAGAAPQRLLWASTGTKDPAYSDVYYVEALIGPDTVDTLPPKTLDAFADHGVVSVSLTADVEGARAVLSETEALGLDLADVTAGLTKDGVAKFAEAFDGLLAAVATKRAAILGARLNSQDIRLPQALAAEVDALTVTATRDGWPRRLWAKDASLWTGGDEAAWLGWLPAALGECADLPALEALAARAKGCKHAVLLGMGGSSLGPEVLAEVFGPAPGHPALHVLDSTDPAQVARVDAAIDPASTLFIVSSKSGSTLEVDVLRRHFFARVEAALGAGQAGQRFVAVTDPGSGLEATARADGYAQVLLGDPEIGGRFSVLSPFGLAAAAVLGLDVPALLAGARTMALACGEGAPPAANPGVRLGLVLGAAAKAGRDKLTFVASKGCAPLGAWLEQLIAESTGKHGLGIIPVDGEPLGEAAAYGDDRVFVFLTAGQDAHARLAGELAAAGHPVIRIDLATPGQIVQEFVRWEVATAIAGAVLGIDPFDQPDVEASKVKARELAAAFEAGGAPERDPPLLVEDGLALHVGGETARALCGKTDGTRLDGVLAAFLGSVRPYDYVGLLAWIERSPAHAAALQAMRAHLRDKLGAATVLGFGPRFLHSTGQAYKGGPDTGVFLEITAAPAADLPIPGKSITFGQVEAAQALGDMAVLIERGRRVLRIDLGTDVGGGLARLAEALDRALG